MSGDLTKAILDMLMAFQRHGMAPPESITLSNPDDGRRLLHAARDLSEKLRSSDLRLVVRKPVEEPDGSAWFEIEVYGVIVRWRATKYAKPRGGFAWE